MLSPDENTQRGAGAHAAVGPRVQRLCDLLGVAGARLALVGSEGPEVLTSVGLVASNLAELDRQTIASGHSLIMADSRATGPSDVRFYVGLLIIGSDDGQTYLLSLFDSRPRSTTMAEHLAALAHEAAGLYEIERQRRIIDAQKATIADYAAVEEHRRNLFDRASATARIGIWQCNLGDSSVIWTNGVYDLFEIPRNTPVTRQSTLKLYTEASRLEMEAARAAAIASCSDFALDCEIVTMTGKRRWMRLTGAVESRDGVAYRIFGMKQDITEEKLMADRTRYLAEFDAMTGLANRSLFQSGLARLDDGGKGVSALLLVDLDGFKQVNDTYGHAVGDECLKEAAQRLIESCGNADLVARIGGDEFAVLLGADVSPEEAAALARHIVGMIGRPMLRGGHRLTLGASVGVAHYRGGTSDDLFREADIALYAAKAAGRNTSRAYVADAA